MLFMLMSFVCPLVFMVWMFTAWWCVFVCLFVCLFVCYCCCCSWCWFYLLVNTRYIISMKVHLCWFSAKFNLWSQHNFCSGIGCVICCDQKFNFSLYDEAVTNARNLFWEKETQNSNKKLCSISPVFVLAPNPPQAQPSQATPNTASSETANSVAATVDWCRWFSVSSSSSHGVSSQVWLDGDGDDEVGEDLLLLLRRLALDRLHRRHRGDHLYLSVDLNGGGMERHVKSEYLDHVVTFSWISEHCRFNPKFSSWWKNKMDGRPQSPFF